MFWDDTFSTGMFEVTFCDGGEVAVVKAVAGSANIVLADASSCSKIECCTSQARTSLDPPKSVLSSSSGCGREDPYGIPLEVSVLETTSSLLLVFANGL